MGTASQFLLDKNKTADATLGDKGFSLKVAMTSGNFERQIAATKGKANNVGPFKWPLREILPWLSFVEGLDANAEIQFTTVATALANASAFRYTSKTVSTILLFADN